MALMAVYDYLNTLEKDPPEFDLEALFDGKSLSRVRFDSFDQPPLKLNVPARDLAAGREMPLDLKYQGRGAGYYTLRLNYAEEAPDLTPYQAGFTLSRTYSRAEAPEGESSTGTTFKRGEIVRVDVTLLVPNQRHWVVLEDPLPAGLEPLNFDLPVVPQHLAGLLKKGQRPADYFRRYWYHHREIRSQRVVVYARLLREGVYTFSYLARAVTPGEFIVPGPMAEEMYSPEVNGRGSGTRFEVVE